MNFFDAFRRSVTEFENAEEGSPLKVRCRVVSGTAIKAPLTGRECVWYRVWLCSQSEIDRPPEIDIHEAYLAGIEVQQGVDHVRLQNFLVESRVRRTSTWKRLRPHLERIDEFLEARGHFAGSISARTFFEEYILQVGDRVTLTGQAAFETTTDGYRGGRRLAVRRATLRVR